MSIIGHCGSPTPMRTLLKNDIRILIVSEFRFLDEGANSGPDQSLSALPRTLGPPAGGGDHLSAGPAFTRLNFNRSYFKSLIQKKTGKVKNL